MATPSLASFDVFFLLVPLKSKFIKVLPYLFFLYS